MNNNVIEEEIDWENSLYNILNNNKSNEKINSIKKSKGINDDTIKNINDFEDYNLDEICEDKKIVDHLNNNYEKKKILEIQNNVINKIMQSKNSKLDLNTKSKNILGNYLQKIKVKKENEKKKEQYPLHWINPNSKKLAIWNFINLLIISYSITFISFYITFQKYNVRSPVQISEVIIDIIFVIDFFKNFFLCYLNQKYQIVKDLKKIVLHYLFTWFMIDLFTSIPLSIIYFNDETTRNIVKIWKILRIWKFLKISKIYLNYITFVINLKPYLKRIFSSSIIIMLLFHAISCIWIISARLYDNQDNWININNKTYSSQYEIYLTALYWTIQTIFTVGYGDIGAHNVNERFVAIIVMFIGVFIYSFLVGSISSIINLFSTDKDNLNNNKQILRQIQKKYELKTKFVKKIDKFIKENSKIVGNKEELISELPIKVQNELNYQMNQYMLNGIFYFVNKSKEFKGFISPHLRLIQFNKGDIVYNENEVSNEIYFLKKGKVILKKLYKKKYIDLLILRNGFYFGEWEILSGNINRIHKVVAYTDLELLAVSYNVVQESFFKYFPDVGTELIELGVERKQRYQNLYEERKLIIKKKRILEKQVLSKYKKSEMEEFLKSRLLQNVLKYNKLKKIKILHFIFIIENKLKRIFKLHKALNKHLKNNNITNIIQNKEEDKENIISEMKKNLVENLEIENMNDNKNFENLSLLIKDKKELIKNSAKNINLNILINNYHNSTDKKKFKTEKDEHKEVKGIIKKKKKSSKKKKKKVKLVDNIDKPKTDDLKENN